MTRRPTSQRKLNGEILKENNSSENSRTASTIPRHPRSFSNIGKNCKNIAKIGLSVKNFTNLSVVQFLPQMGHLTRMSAERDSTTSNSPRIVCRVWRVQQVYRQGDRGGRFCWGNIFLSYSYQQFAATIYCKYNLGGNSFEGPGARWRLFFFFGGGDCHVMFPDL